MLKLFHTIAHITSDLRANMIIIFQSDSPRDGRLVAWATVAVTTNQGGTDPPMGAWPRPIYDHTSDSASVENKSYDFDQ